MTMTVVGLVGAVAGTIAAWFRTPAALMITALGAILAVLGVGLLRDLRRPRPAARRRDITAGGLLPLYPTGDVGGDSGGGWSGGGDSGGGGS
ncbi:hypothetical protein GA0070620_5911 [Micromonospora krabiensis]|uniref:Uncharacterized protein n=1 Tax=Micromonospora krabiensis TaxID=307121 RepID=A0A1C3NCK0_9ACTN|nr:hypothetical protein GA0070620_5911 [Micromonospora krabiensis]